MLLGPLVSWSTLEFNSSAAAVVNISQLRSASCQLGFLTMLYSFALFASLFGFVGPKKAPFMEVQWSVKIFIILLIIILVLFVFT